MTRALQDLAFSEYLLRFVLRNSNFGTGVLHVKRQILTYFLGRHFSARSSFYCLFDKALIRHTQRCLQRTIEHFLCCEIMDIIWETVRTLHLNFDIILGPI